MKTKMQVLAIRGVVSMLPEVTQATVKDTITQLSTLVEAAGPAGVLAFALFAGEFSAKLEGSGMSSALDELMEGIE